MGEHTEQGEQYMNDAASAIGRISVEATQATAQWGIMQLGTIAFDDDISTYDDVISLMATMQIGVEASIVRSGGAEALQWINSMHDAMTTLWPEIDRLLAGFVKQMVELEVGGIAELSQMYRERGLIP